MHARAVSRRTARVSGARGGARKSGGAVAGARETAAAAVAGAAGRAVVAGARGESLPREQLVEIQRARLLAAAVVAIDELGYADTTVSDVTNRARVSRRTFYELFSNREECLAAVLEDVVVLVRGEIAAAGLEGLAWCERVRGGLWAVLSFLDREPVLARVCVVQSLRGGAEVLVRREEILAGLARVVDEGRIETARGGQCTPLTAEGVVGAAFAIVYARLLRGEPGPLTGLLGELMAMIVLPYRGAAAARRELARPEPSVSPHGAPRLRAPAGGAVGDPLQGVSMRLTYRTARVLEGVAARPGASNREVAERAGIEDPGQVSKLLARLERLGLLVNTSGGHAKGEPNAWSLTSLGERVTAQLSLKDGRGREAA
jgi:AcrR family transcriptional regulator